MSFIFHPDAEKEFNEAIDYYENVSPELGYNFALEVYAAIQRAIVYPKAWPIINNKIRRSLTKRFPYGILYYEIDSELFILAVMHLHRKPDYWEYRIK